MANLGVQNVVQHGGMQSKTALSAGPAHDCNQDIDGNPQQQTFGRNWNKPLVGHAEGKKCGQAMLQDLDIAVVVELIA